jgi:N-acetylmuramoyl-L-alanine amidase
VFTQQFLARNWYLSINPDNALYIIAPAAPSPPNLDQEYEQVKGKLRFDTVIIDPGHGGHDPGNVGYRNAREKDVVLSISKKLGSYIEEYLPDVKVIYTREADSYVDLEDEAPLPIAQKGICLYLFMPMVGLLLRCTEAPFFSLDYTEAMLRLK